jgi:hypothetical protein
MTLIELCAGTASLSLWALGQHVPLTGYMGSKRRWASLLVDALGVRDPDHVVLVDAGPWGDVWSVLRLEAGRAATLAALLNLDACLVNHGPARAWSVSLEPPHEEPGRRVAHFLWLQARSAGTIPVWWDASNGRWESPTGSRTEAAHARGGTGLGSRQKGSAVESSWSRATRAGAPAAKRCRGIQRPLTIATRLRALGSLPWERVDVVHGDVRDVPPIPGATVYFDPPYLGCPRYSALLPRSDVLEVATRWASAGCRVAVSEAEPLPLAGWYTAPLPQIRQSREWLTSSERVRVQEQLPLLNVVAP